MRGFATIRFALPSVFARQLAQGPLILVPGATVGGDAAIYAPVNAIGAVRARLRAAGISAWKEDVGYGAPRWWRVGIEKGRASRGAAGSDDGLPCEARRDAPPLFNYQREALAFACARSGSHLWHSAGAGKTRPAALFLLSGAGTSVFVCRAFARDHIARQFRRYTTVDPLVLEGGLGGAWIEKETVEIKKRLDEGVRIVIVGWEALPTWLPILTQLRPTRLVLDEAHRGKSSKRWNVVRGADPGEVKFEPKANFVAAAMQLTRLRSVEQRLCTTATPVKNLRRDLWAQLDYAEPYQWGNVRDFRRAYCGADTTGFNGSLVDAKDGSNTDDLLGRLAHVVHHVPHEVTHREVPPLRREAIRVPVDQQVFTGLPSMRDILRDAAGNPARLFELHLMRAAARKRAFAVKLAVEQVEGTRKVVVFTGRREEVATIEKAVKSTAGRDVWVRGFHGGDSDRKRDRLCVEYMAHSGPAVLVATTDAAGESIELQTTDALIVTMLPWTPGAVEQLEGRVHRVGQDRPVTVFYTIAKRSVDEQVARILIDKLPDVSAVTGEQRMAAAATTLEGLEGNEQRLLEELAEKLAADPSSKWEEMERELGL